MSHGSEKIIEGEQENFDKHLAKELGITYDELLELDYEIDEEVSNDGGIIYNYIISFGENASKEILKKIEGIDEQSKVWIPSSVVDNWK